MAGHKETPEVTFSSSSPSRLSMASHPVLLYLTLALNHFVSLDSFSSFSLSRLPMFPCSSLSFTCGGGDDAVSLGRPSPSLHRQGEFARRAAVTTHSRKRRENISAHLSLNMFAVRHINTFFCFVFSNNFELLTRATYSTTFWFLQFPCLPQPPPPPFSLSLFPACPSSLPGTNYRFPPDSH